MLEVALALALALGGLALVALPPQVAMWCAAAITGLALVVGIIASTVYHLRLRAALRPRGLLPSHWWIHPLPLHKLLDEHPDVRRAVLTPFYVGVACAVLCLCAALMGSVFAVRMVL